MGALSERAPGAKLLVKCPETGDLSEVDASSIVEGTWCGSCEERVEETKPRYECSSCGEEFTREESMDGDSNRCPSCNRFGARTDDACGECDSADDLEEEVEVYQCGCGSWHRVDEAETDREKEAALAEEERVNPLPKDPLGEMRARLEQLGIADLPQEAPGSNKNWGVSARYASKGALLNQQDQRRVELSGPGIGPPQGGPHRAYRVILPTREALKLVRSIPSGASRLDFSTALGWKLHELGIISTVYTNVLFETLTAMNVESHTDGISIMARNAPKKDPNSTGEWVTVYKRNRIWMECPSEVLMKDLADVPMDAGLDATIEALEQARLKRQPYRL